MELKKPRVFPQKGPPPRDWDSLVGARTQGRLEKPEKAWGWLVTRTPTGKRIARMSTYHEHSNGIVSSLECLLIVRISPAPFDPNCVLPSEVFLNSGQEMTRNITNVQKGLLCFALLLGFWTWWLKQTTQIWFVKTSTCHSTFFGIPGCPQVYEQKKESS